MPEIINSAHVWNGCLDYVRKRVPQQTFDTWFAPIKPISIANETLLLQVPNKFFYDWVDSHYREMILKALSEITGNGFGVNYTILLGEDAETSGPTAKIPSATNRDKTQMPVENDIKSGMFEQGTRLNDRYIFETYVEGSSNQFARAAAMAVASAPGRTSFNPLVIYGGTGLGKTHLLQAIGNEALGSGRAKKVVYVSSDTFTLDFIAAVQKNRRPSFLVTTVALICFYWTTFNFSRIKNKHRSNFSYI
jgi:chromosomal replication initiator protein